MCPSPHAWRLGLSERQARFVEAYDGNGVAAARAAGYHGSRQTLARRAAELMKKVEVLLALDRREREERAGGAAIATREERQAFWTRVMLDPEIEMRDRLRAAELLGRSQADFVDRVEVSGVSLETLLLAAYERLRRGRQEEREIEGSVVSIDGDGAGEGPSTASSSGGVEDVSGPQMDSVGDAAGATDRDVGQDVGPE